MYCPLKGYRPLYYITIQNVLLLGLYIELMDLYIHRVQQLKPTFPF